MDERFSDELNLRRLPAVGAPPGFEARVFARIAAEKERRAHHRSWARPRLAFAGAGVALLAAVVVFGPFLRRGGAPVSFASGASAAGAGMIPLMETADYAAEMKTASGPARPVVYILEQVSEAPLSEISY